MVTMSERLSQLAPPASSGVAPQRAPHAETGSTAPASRRSTWHVNWGGYGVFLLGVGVVEILARLGWLTSYVPPPSVIFAALWRGMIDGDISGQIGVTLSVYVRGLALAAVLAVLIGI